MLGKTLSVEDIKPFDILTTLDKKRMIIVMDILAADDPLVIACKWQPYVALKENGKDTLKVDIKTFEEQLAGGRLAKFGLAGDK